MIKKLFHPLIGLLIYLYSDVSTITSYVLFYLGHHNVPTSNVVMIWYPETGGFFHKNFREWKNQCDSILFIFFDTVME